MKKTINRVVITYENLNKSQGQNVCDYCGQRFRGFDGLLCHKRSHHLREQYDTVVELLKQSDSPIPAFEDWVQRYASRW